MGLKTGRIAVILVLTVAATVGMADLLRTPGQPLRFDKARAKDLLDADAPIVTARYREPTDAQLAAVGLARIPVEPRPAQIVAIDDPPSAPPYNMAQLSPPPARISLKASLTPPAQSAFQGPDPEALEALSRRATLVAGQAQTVAESVSTGGKALLLKVAAKPADRRKGRWFIFAAASDKAFELNLVRDEAMGGFRKAGWSVERLAAYGQAQVGIGWRKAGSQVSLAAARREIGDLGVRIYDTVAGVNWSWRPQET